MFRCFFRKELGKNSTKYVPQHQWRFFYAHKLLVYELYEEYF